jgi:hypothetical protein
MGFGVGFEPAPWWDSRCSPHRSLTTFGTAFAHPNQAMNRIQMLHLTGGMTAFHDT